MSPESTSRQCRLALSAVTPSMANPSLPVNSGFFIALMIAARTVAVTRCAGASLRGVPSLFAELLFA